MDVNLALITGATSGIGKALAELLAVQGIDLILTGRNQTILDELQRELGKKVQVNVLMVDLIDTAQRQKLIRLIHEKAPDLVINNAGWGLYGDMLSYDTEQHRQILEVNGVAVLELSLEAARTLISKQKKGTICNVSSAAAFLVMPGLGSYAAAKSFVNAFSQTLDYEVEKYGVRVLTSCPGMVSTDFTARAGGKKYTNSTFFKSMTPEYVAEQIWKQIQQQKSLQIIDWRYRLSNYLASLLPKRWVAQSVGAKIAQRIEPRQIKTLHL